MNSPSLPRQEFPDSRIFSGSGTTGQESGSVARVRFNARNIDKSAIDNFLAGMNPLDIRNLAGRVCAEAQKVCPGQWCNNELKKVFERHDIEYGPTGYDGSKPPRSQVVVNLLLGLQKDSGQKKSDDTKPLHERFCALLQDGQGVFTGGQQLLITEIGKHVGDSASVPGTGLIPSVKGTSQPEAPPACPTDEAENSVASAVKSDVNKPVDQVERAAVDTLSGEFSQTSDCYEPVVARTGVKLTSLAGDLNMRRVDFYQDKYVSTSLSIAVDVKPGYPVVPVVVGMKANIHLLPDYIQRRLAKACPHTPDEMVTFVHAFMIADTSEAFCGTGFKIVLDSKIDPEYGSLYKESENQHYSPVTTTVSLPKELVNSNRFFRTCWSVHEQGADDDVVTLSYGKSGDNDCCDNIGFDRLHPIIEAKGSGEASTSHPEVGLAIPFGVQICRQSDRVLRRLRHEPSESEDRLAGLRSVFDQSIGRIFHRGTQSNNSGSVDSGIAPSRDRLAGYRGAFDQSIGRIFHRGTQRNNSGSVDSGVAPSRDRFASWRSSFDQSIGRIFRRGTQNDNSGSVDSGIAPIAPPSESLFSSLRPARTVLTNSTGLVSVRTVTGIKVSTAGELESRLLDKAHCTGSEGQCKIPIL